MFVRMWPTSPKVRDLQHDPRYALHSLMDNFEGVGGEFFVAGRAARVDDPTLIASASVGKHVRSSTSCSSLASRRRSGRPTRRTNRSVVVWRAS
jgi:hypothetical protein